MPILPNLCNRKNFECKLNLANLGRVIFSENRDQRTKHFNKTSLSDQMGPNRVYLSLSFSSNVIVQFTVDLMKLIIFINNQQHKIDISVLNDSHPNILKKDTS